MSSRRFTTNHVSPLSRISLAVPILCPGPKALEKKTWKERNIETRLAAQKQMREEAGSCVTQGIHRCKILPSRSSHMKRGRKGAAAVLLTCLYVHTYVYTYTCTHTRLAPRLQCQMQVPVHSQDPACEDGHGYSMLRLVVYD